MADEIFGLSEADIGFIRRMYQDLTQIRRYLNLNPMMDPHSPDVYQAMDHYLVKVPTGQTLSALSSDTPGKQACELFRIAINATGVMTDEDIVAMEDNDSNALTVDVYNVTDVEITPSMGYFSVSRLKTGGYVCFKAPVFKSLVRFELTADLDITDSTGSATILSQHGPGVTNPNSSITLGNPATSTGDRQYYGVTGAEGWAMWDYGSVYQILDLECP